MKKIKYKKVFSMTGELGLRNYTVRDIIDLKGEKQLTQTLPFIPNEAKAAEDAGIDIMNTRFNYFKQETAIEIRKSASKTFMSFVIPLLSVPTKDDALKHSYKAMELGADGIIFQGSLNHIEALSKAGIPVQGHIGLVPRKSTWTGGIRAVGKTIDEAKALFQNLKDLENAGAWAVECEVIPSRLMRELSSRTSLVTISIGSGNGGDVQFLFAEDILGASEGPFPRHSKQYCNLFKEAQRIQKIRVNAFKDFIDDVNSDIFPSNNFEVEVTEELVERFCNYLDKT
jgi:3-methyl-2-oxobutanoate hydroxymethyltransferase|tara:strand:- start:5433 stop:6287 length:855 start_codon:yes stop_codon:yes gene_type:complete